MDDKCKSEVSAYLFMNGLRLKNLKDNIEDYFKCGYLSESLLPLLDSAVKENRELFKKYFVEGKNEN